MKELNVYMCGEGVGKSMFNQQMTPEEKREYLIKLNDSGIYNQKDKQ